jgi:hypothetical protein
MSNLAHSPTHFARSLITENFEPVAQKSIKLLRLAGPKVSSVVARQKYYFMSSAVLASLTGSQPNGRLDQLTVISNEQVEISPHELGRSLVNFVTAGLEHG